jgi:hypothetical protein
LPDQVREPNGTKRIPVFFPEPSAAAKTNGNSEGEVEAID